MNINTVLDWTRRICFSFVIWKNLTNFRKKNWCVFRTAYISHFSYWFPVQRRAIEFCESELMSSKKYWPMVIGYLLDCSKMLKMSKFNCWKNQFGINTIYSSIYTNSLCSGMWKYGFTNLGLGAVAHTTSLRSILVSERLTLHDSVSWSDDFECLKVSEYNLCRSSV